ncbi:porin family protein [Carboxylicivirga marina]|uniref:porin family protein n=1 Tax=Carboxylicivirga marina TaxID=2800988 RepID=UPI002596E470|nr:porin family protein [uncultured Carboxylicivirga sp.]
MDKLKLIIIVVLLFGTVNTFSQNEKFNIGIELGPSITFLRGNEIINEYGVAKMGYITGLTFQYNLTDAFSLKSGLTYERKGGGSEITVSDGIGTPHGVVKGKINMDYIGIPVLAKYKFGINNMFFINGGPFIGYLMKATSMIESYKEYPSSSADDTETYKRIDLGLSLGIGLSHYLSDKISISLEVRNNLGLLNTGENVYKDDSILTNSTGLLFGITYSLPQN